MRIGTTITLLAALAGCSDSPVELPSPIDPEPCDGGCDETRQLCDSESNTCRPRGVGDPCAPGADSCPEDLFCGPDNNCQSGETGDLCRSDEHCDVRCGPDGRCQEGIVDDPCESDSDCDELCGPEGLCQAGEAGDPCTSNGQCVELCGPGVCQAGEVGDPCESDNHCLELCGPAGECHAGTAGDPCTSPTQCVTATCGPEVCQEGSNGDACSDSSHCIGLCGPDGVCQSGVVGDPCSSTDQCLGLCGPTYVCQNGEVGDPCANRSDCDGLRCNSAGTCSVLTYDPANVGSFAHEVAYGDGLLCNRSGSSVSTRGWVRECVGSTNFKVVAQTDRTMDRISVYYLDNLTIPSGRRLEVEGANPVAFIVKGDVIIDGTLRADNGSNGTDGPVCSRSDGSPLLSGGVGPTPGTTGGGAIQISAGRSIKVGPSGVIKSQWWNNAYGGSIVLEAPTISIQGSLQAYGASKLEGGLVQFNTADGNADIAVDAIIDAECTGQGTLAPFTGPAPQAPACAAVDEEESQCEQCMSRHCCEAAEACFSDELCSTCVSSASPGPACDDDPLKQAYDRCRVAWCPRAC